jgi:arylsulfatase A-like enzyme
MNIPSVEKEIHRHLSLCFLVVALLSSFLSEMSAQVAVMQRPNVLFILADDIGWNDIGIYSSVASPGKDTSKVIRTPNIDSLAQAGMRFTDAHTPMTLCAPNRFSFLTGSNPYRNGRTGGSWGLSSSSGFSAGTASTGSVGKHLTLGDVMKAAGYATTFLGKTHLGGTAYTNAGEEIHKIRWRKSRTNPFLEMDYARGIDDSICRHGFDYALTLEDGIQGPPYAWFLNGKFKPIDPLKPADNSSVKDWKRQKPHKAGKNGISEFAHKPFMGDVDYDSSQIGVRLAREAVNFIGRHQRANKSAGKQTPFFLYYSPEAIHWPHTPPIDFDGDPTTIDVPVKGVTPGPTSDMIYALDLQVGAILEKLKDEGILNNTLIIFTSDNGGLKPTVANFGEAEHDTTGVLRGQKATVYEGGHRVPFIARWGDGTAAGSKIAPGKVNHHLIAAHDWVATLYELTNQSIREGQAMDSVSLLPTLLGKHPAEKPIRDFMSMGFPGIRAGDYFLLCERKKSNKPIELYNLEQDISQTKNLISDPAQKDRIRELHALMLKHNNCDGRDMSEERSTPAFKVAAN